MYTSMNKITYINRSTLFKAYWTWQSNQFLTYIWKLRIGYSEKKLNTIIACNIIIIMLSINWKCQKKTLLIRVYNTNYTHYTEYNTYWHNTDIRVAGAWEVLLITRCLERKRNIKTFTHILLHRDATACAMHG